VLVAAVAERQPPGRPLTLLRAPLDPGADAIDDGRVLELGEDAEHLEHHPPSGGAGVERLGCRAQHHAVRIEFFGELRELAHLPGEPGDAVDEQEVDPSLRA
jgi:hypothetical protein